MSFPPTTPWSDLPSQQFFIEVQAVRLRQPALVAAAERGDLSYFEAYVEARWPAPLQEGFVGDLPQPGSAPGRPEPEVIDYSGVVHNRNLDDREHVERVAKIVMILLTEDNVDDVAVAEVYLLEGPGWAGTVARLRADFPPTWRWSVESGNHRLIAQHVLGVGPYAVVRDAEYWN